MEIKSKPKPVKAPPKKRKKIRFSRATRRKELYLALDKAIREIVLDRDCSCVCPPPQNGHTDVMQPGHLISRTKESVRWSLWNVYTQCSGCNLRHEFTPHIFTNWFLGEFGQEKYHELCDEANKVQKLQLYELEELLFQLKKIREKQLVEELTGNPYKPYFSQREILSGAWNK